MPSRKEMKRRRKAAKHLPNKLQDFAFTKASNRVFHPSIPADRRHSEVRSVDPAEYVEAPSIKEDR